ncbi:MAG TPA: hypothetical protein VEQ59_02590 [Polyangiaceae bacterium]|nr:hypothetical protein [Polyangiaceae bacterium]
MNTLRFDIVDHVLVIVHADVPPADDDWRRLILVRNANRQKIRGNLVVAPPRASINAAQRADVAAFTRETGIVIAVVTESALVRGVALAIGLLGVPVRGFAPLQLKSALDFLSVPSSRHAELLRTVEALRAQLAVIEKT